TGRERDRDAELLSGARGEDLAIGVLHAHEPDGRQRGGDRDVDARHLRGDVALLDVLRHALAEVNRVEVACVGAVGVLGPRAAVGVVVEHSRHALAGELPQVLDAGDHRHASDNIAFMHTPVMIGPVPVDFILFGLVLAGIGIFTHHTLRVAVYGLAVILVYKLAFTGFPHGGAGFAGLVGLLEHEWVVLVNLFLLLMGFALL